MDHGLISALSTARNKGTDHGTKGDETDQGIWGQQTQADYQGFSQSLEFILVDTSVNNVKEDGWDLSRSRKGIFDSGVLGQQLGRQVGCRDILVMRRERVSLKTERTDPEFASDVDLTTGYQQDWCTM
jgi:hypothetical protein